MVVPRQPLKFSWRDSELPKGDLLDAATTLKADAGINGTGGQVRSPGAATLVTAAPGRRYR